MNLLLFSLCWMLPVDSMLSIPLNMSDKAVDDMYDGCNRTMEEKAKNKYFEQENTGIFADVWRNAADCAEHYVKNRDPEDQALTKDHMQAICVYTADYKKFYETFNDHVRNNRSIYGSHFPFHSLHFWLTSAVQILNQNKKCHTTYRRTNLEFNGSINQIIRFGYFASSSYKTTLLYFGRKTCFKIRTCSGGFMKRYSAFWDLEQEVLIPPYETFRITAKSTGGDVKGLSDCEVVYVLETTGVQSDLNCNVVSISLSFTSILIISLVVCCVIVVCCFLLVCCCRRSFLSGDAVNANNSELSELSELPL